MLFLVSLALAGAISLTGIHTVKRHPYLWYTAALCLSLLASFCPFPDTLPPAAAFLLDLLRRGSFAAALWCIVMWTGALPDGSLLIKQLMPVRSELSILAACLTLGHIFSHSKIRFSQADPMASGQLAGFMAGKILLIIMVLLTILSLPRIRRSIKTKKWKQLQRFAYLFYALLYFHILLLFLPLAKSGQESYYLSIVFYTAVFLGYAICRIRKWYLHRRKILP